MKWAKHLPGAAPVFLLAALLTGCASIQAPLPPSLELPKPPTDLRAVRKGERVYLFWTLPAQTTDRQNIRHPGPTRICRSLEVLMSDCAPVGNEESPRLAKSSNSEPQAVFVDTLPSELQQQNSNRLVTYAVEALNVHARSAGLSNQVHVPLATTLPPPANFRTEVTADGVDLTWDCALPDTSDSSHLYRIYRRSSESGVDLRLAEVDCNGGRYRDRSIEWAKNYEYRITVLTSAKINEQAVPCPGSPALQGKDTRQDCNVVTVEGDDSSLQKVFTKDVYPPGVPSGLQAVFSGPGQPPFIDLLWAPATAADLAGYNVYRREESGALVKISTDLVKTPAFRDTNVAAGKTYWYAVTAVDQRGNESARSEEASEAVPQS
jgi:fibronectin type 3 domain-containing protein